jgi:arginase
MSIETGSTLRLNLPQWQGGDEPEYHFGGQLLAWLAPKPSGPVETIPVPEARPGERGRLENGVVERSQLLRQIRETRQAIEKHRPDRIVTLGGDCLVSLAPAAYLNSRYGGKLGMLWVDAHPDVMTPSDFPHAHAHVLGILLGRGDRDFTNEVQVPLVPSRVMYAGLNSWLPVEDEVIKGLGLRHAGSATLAETSAPVLNWITEQKIEHVAIHFDLDVQDPSVFRPLLFNKPDLPLDSFPGVPRGRMLPDQVVRLLQDVARACGVVGLAITEHLPWDMIGLRDMLRKLPLLGGLA